MKRDKYATEVAKSATAFEVPSVRLPAKTQTRAGKDLASKKFAAHSRGRQHAAHSASR